VIDHAEGPYVPVLDQDPETGDWLLAVYRAPLVRFPKEQRGLASNVWSCAMWSYRNGADHAKGTIRQALGIE
jgi:hypothetical protein